MKERYSRQILFSPIGENGQRKLNEKHVLLIGAGALGTSNAEMLARAGVGKITVVDRDYVEWSNLQRQQLYTERDAMERIPKAVAAADRLREINSEIKISGEIMDVSIHEIEELIDGVDVMIDATDNFETRLLLNDASQKYQVPWVYGACTGSYGLSYTVVPGQTPCFSCLLGSVPMGGETCDTVGIISPAVQIVAAYQTTEALKLLVEDYKSLRRNLFYFDIWKNQQSTIKVEKLKKDDCPSCGQAATYPHLDPVNLSRTAVLCGRDTVQIRPANKEKRNLDELSDRLQAVEGGRVEGNSFLVNLTVEGRRLVAFQDGRVLVHDTKDISEAKTLYNRYIGG
ncbi:thiamine biosynthesis protein MoeB [Halobacillus halophilus]|uniref:Thiamine/molybdopterin biosynthesis ThiF/MoeB-like protein n=1 Tax=Halobacillus halophilus (strain ATCC 35676 / DSM 2266 / JCM 20832 / KCTC 3685 / LMG 17431 / NBRC 102448 / NCIMB 2269) TaxID=866895 RepID=I0JNP2_HALH3|nr:thiazole biosynthesis adenylyltransferase ThiF [Halobacillus halophilus]ASF39810.1 thiamine biosynthesis protein MoeB [Halobacillus halophilus]CCG45762.1 thiamine/molybdopterin biosynthesis ThiF/MoeB-like protein [Halobacillus halophilus DSM 2266]